MNNWSVEQWAAALIILIMFAALIYIVHTQSVSVSFRPSYSGKVVRLRTGTKGVVLLDKGEVLHVLVSVGRGWAVIACSPDDVLVVYHD